MRNRLLRRPAVSDLTGRGNWALYDDIKKGLMTKGVRVGIRAVGWPESEVVALNQARIAGKSPEEIRELVTQLHAKRNFVTEWE